MNHAERPGGCNVSKMVMMFYPRLTFSCSSCYALHNQALTPRNTIGTGKPIPHNFGIKKALMMLRMLCMLINSNTNVGAPWAASVRSASQTGGIYRHLGAEPEAPAEERALRNRSPPFVFYKPICYIM